MTEPDIVRPGNDTLVKVKINGHEYHAKYNKNCHTCTHPARLAIEEALLGQVSYQKIADQYSGVVIEGENGEAFTCPELSWQSVRTHYKAGHMPLEVAALRALADKRSEELSEQYQGTLHRYVDRYEVAETILARGYERIMSGATEVDAKDTLAAAKFLHEAEQGTTVDAEAWSQAMQVYFETAQRLMPEDVWKQFVTELSVNPVLRAIEQKMNNEDNGVIDAEVVDP